MIGVKLGLKPNDSILDIKEKKREDDGEETVDWGMN